MTKPGLSDSIFLASPTMLCMISGHAAYSTLELGPVKQPCHCAQNSMG